MTRLVMLPDIHLVFEGRPDQAWQARGFRKIRPSAMSEIEMLRALCDVPAKIDSGVRA